MHLPSSPFMPDADAQKHPSFLSFDAHAFFLPFLSCRCIFPSFPLPFLSSHFSSSYSTFSSNLFSSSSDFSSNLSSLSSLVSHLASFTSLTWGKQGLSPG
eukprot:Tamp_11828.p3 GENE.Tamp_11828~~Tamp_11828.p3  ORF type:complete len:100 (+),score=7.57 Tamp_11828:530-829(+)